MGQENNAGDTNAGGQDSNNSSSNDTILSTECSKNKVFFDKYGLYPGFYTAGDWKVEIKNDETIKITYENGYFSILNLAEKKEFNSYDSSEYDILNFCSNYSYETLTKKISYNTSERGRQITFDSNSAFLIGGHEDCTNFKNKEYNFYEIYGIEEKKYELLGYNDTYAQTALINTKVEISSNSIIYEDEYCNLKIDFKSEKIYDLNSNKSRNINLVKKQQSFSNGVDEILGFYTSDQTGSTPNLKFDLKDGKIVKTYVYYLNRW